MPINKVYDLERLFDAIKEKALSTGQWSQTQLDSMNRQQLVSLIFAPGFSTANTVSIDSGRGMGMDIIKQRMPFDQRIS